MLPYVRYALCLIATLILAAGAILLTGLTLAFGSSSTSGQILEWTIIIMLALGAVAAFVGAVRLSPPLDPKVFSLRKRISNDG